MMAKNIIEHINKAFNLPHPKSSLHEDVCEQKMSLESGQCWPETIGIKLHLLVTY